MERRRERIDGRECTVYIHGRGGPVIYWGVAKGRDETETVASLLAQMTKDLPWTLAAFEAEDWNRDFSPWALPSACGDDPFTGEAKQTLDWLVRSCMPHIESHVSAGSGVRLIGGYSLSGLFSLLAFYESGLFRGAASCSGSLWFPGWKQYAARMCAPKGSVVYLSLGSKEEKTRNQAMAAVGDMTRWQYDRLRQDAHVRESALVWHPGGHFTDIQRRIAQGFAWMIRHAKEDADEQKDGDFPKA